MRRTHAAICVFVLLAIACGGDEAQAQTACHPVAYHVGQNWIATGGSRGSAGISVRPSDLTLDNLLCLVTTLRREHPEWTEIAIMFFDWPEAAERYRVGWEHVDFVGSPPPFRRYEQHLLAFYSLEAAAREQFLMIMPFGWQNGSDTYASRLDLPVASKPHCRHELKHRCLMSAVSETERVRVRGVVTLRARITAEGRVVDVVVEQARSARSEQKQALIDAARAELQSWRLDRAKADESIRVSYAYAPDEEIADVETQIDLPNGAIVRELSVDDELLLVVGNSQLKENRRIRCVTGHYLGNDRFGEISDWLFERLRRQRKSLTRCSNDSSFDFDSELLLGPVVWRTPSLADVYFGWAGGVISQDGYRAERDAAGRWWFTRLTRE